MLHGKRMLGRRKRKAIQKFILTITEYLFHENNGLIKEGNTVQCIRGEVVIKLDDRRLN